jgi:hypothetical protein
VKGIIHEVYPREGDMHVFQTPSNVKKYQDDQNPREELLLPNLENSSSSKL